MTDVLPKQAYAPAYYMRLKADGPDSKPYRGVLTDLSEDEAKTIEDCLRRNGAKNVEIMLPTQIGTLTVHWAYADKDVA